MDISFPSNYELFRNFTKDGKTGWLIGKYPGAEIIHSNYSTPMWTYVLIFKGPEPVFRSFLKFFCVSGFLPFFLRHELYNIEYWGKSVPSQLFKEFPVQVIKALVSTGSMQKQRNSIHFLIKILFL